MHHLKVTSANEHDSNVVSDLMHGEEETLHGDSGYLGSDKKENAITKNKNGKKIKYVINELYPEKWTLLIFDLPLKKVSKFGKYAQNLNNTIRRKALK